MSEDESISGQEKITWHWKRVTLLAVPVVAILIVILVLQPWSIVHKYESNITKAFAAMSEIESFRIVGSSSIDYSEGLSSQLNVEGKFTSPDRFYMKIVDSDQVSEFIIIGDILFINHGGFFYPSTFVSMQHFNNNFGEELLSSYLDMFPDVQELPNEDIEGVSCIHYTGQWDIEREMAETKQGIIETQTSMGIEVDEEEIDRDLEYMRSMTMSTEFWIGRDDYLIRQMRTNSQYAESLAESLEGFNISSTDMTTKYYDFYEPITIEAPVDDDGQLLPGWRIMDILKSYSDMR